MTTEAAHEPPARVRCYCGGPEEAVYGHLSGEGYYCRRKVQTGQRTEQVNNGEGDSEQDTA